MDNPPKHNKIELDQAINQNILADEHVRNFLTLWFKYNSNIKPQIISRKEWDTLRKDEILQEEEDGKHLYIPDDLQLWELVPFIKHIEQNNSKEDSLVPITSEGKINQLGETFRNSGIYIANRLDSIGEGREIAQHLALDFYRYGNALLKGRNNEDIDDIREQNLTPEDTTEIDKFFAGEDFYKEKQEKLQKLELEDLAKEELYEDTRRKTLAKFFRITQKAFELKQKNAEKEPKTDSADLNPWKSTTPIHNAFLEGTKQSIIRSIETPDTEFKMSVFQDGLVTLANEMTPYGWKSLTNKVFKELGLNLELEEERLIDKLKISDCKKELKELRQNGTIGKISEKEQEIANKIQKEIQKFPFFIYGDKPQEILKNKYLNCVGGVMLAGALMKKAGLNYLIGHIEELTSAHAVLLLVTSDDSIIWKDMINISTNEDITNEEILEPEPNQTKSKMVNFSKNPTSESLTVKLDYTNKYPKSSSLRGKGSVIIWEPESGHKIQLLKNTGATLEELGEKEEALEAYKTALRINPKHALIHQSIGIVLNSLERYEEAIESHKKSIQLDPKIAKTYIDLGTSFSHLERYADAIGTYEKAEKLEPNSPQPYEGIGNCYHNLGIHELALEYYKKAVTVAFKSSPLHYKIAICLEALKCYGESIEAYQTARNLLKGDNPELLKEIQEKSENLKKKVM